MFIRESTFYGNESHFVGVVLSPGGQKKWKRSGSFRNLWFYCVYKCRKSSSVVEITNNWKRPFSNKEKNGNKTYGLKIIKGGEEIWAWTTVGCAWLSVLHFVLMILIEKLCFFKVFVTLKSPSGLQSAQLDFHLLACMVKKSKLICSEWKKIWEVFER